MNMLKKLEENVNQVVTDTANMSDEEFFSLSKYNPGSAEKVSYSNYSYWASTWRSFTKNKTAMFFMLLLAGLLIFTIIQPILPNQKSPTHIFINSVTGLQDRNRRPGSEYWLGTNTIGQDMWSRIWSGTRTSLFIGICVGGINAFIGIFVGALWGYVRKLDQLLTEIYNVINNVPETIILILISYLLRPGIKTIIFAMCITGWLKMARFIRNQIVIIRDREYNLASRCLGTPTERLIAKNLLPYLVSVIMLRLALAIPAAIGHEVFLTYIGLGLPVSIPSLGNLVNEGRAVMMSASTRYQLVFPALVLSCITVSFYVIGNAFADAADPKNHV